MKRIINLIIFFLIAASFLLEACSSSTTAPPTTVPTQVTQPTQAAPTTVSPANTPAPTATPLPTSTALPTQAFTPTQPAVTTATLTPIATLANTPTSVPSGHTAVINQNTNCRSGPSSDYELINTFLIGESAKIVSRTSVDGYVLVEDPNNPGQSCWLWTQYVTISGDLSSLPVATAPPPLVNFTIDFTRIETCSSYMLEFKVGNTGQKTIQAYSIVAKDLTEHTQQTTNSTSFNFVNGCVIQQAIEYIDPGKVGYAYASNFTYDPKGNSFEATITICSHNDMTGACATQLVKFTP